MQTLRRSSVRGGRPADSTVISNPLDSEAIRFIRELFSVRVKQNVARCSRFEHMVDKVCKGVRKSVPLTYDHN